MRNRKYLYLHCIRFQNLSSWSSQKTTGRLSMWHGHILSRWPPLFFFSSLISMSIQT
ncbi:hypothetical protein NC651_018037 [Populus alba x Populus x berolinensis]|nr:hypothetical protein NC651_018037 [Populus alba x Populus x berolinensis]